MTFDPRPRVVAVVPTNELPQFTSQPATAGQVGQTYSYAASAIDSDGTVVSYALIQGPAGAVLDPSTGQLGWAPQLVDATEVPFEIRVYDSRYGFANQQWKVTVAGVNRPPQLAPLDNAVLREGDLLRIPVSGSDPDGQRLTFWADNLRPAPSSIHSASHSSGRRMRNPRVATGTCGSSPRMTRSERNSVRHPRAQHECGAAVGGAGRPHAS